jgi:transposase
MVWSRCPQAEICLDPFHVVKWAIGALDEIRREVWNQARRSGQEAVARELKDARFALWKNPEDLTQRQRSSLAQIAKTNEPLYRSYLLKEQLRQVFQLPTQRALALLDDWLIWARRCRLRPFVQLAKNIKTYLPDIENALVHRLSNALVESVNTRIRLITRRAFGFHGPEPLIALVMLSLGGVCPPLPGRS